MLHVTFVGTGPYLRLPEVLAAAGARVTVVGNRRNSLRRSQIVDRFIELDYGATEELAPALLARPDIVDRLDGWVVVADDTTLRLLAVSDLPLGDKLRILPVRRPEGLPFLGSKVGLELLQRQAGTPGPRTVVVERPDLLPAALAELADLGPVLVKADVGGGGEQVRPWRAGDDPASIPASWYPVVVQQLVGGVEGSAEVLFRDGELVGWLYARMLAAMPGGGPSTARSYERPPARDFVGDLMRIGNAGGLHGFFNGSLVWSPREQRHYVFELDARPNAWAQFGPRLGVDWVRQMTVASPGIAEPALAADERRVVHLYPRELIDGLDQRQWAGVRPWLLALPGTWGTRNRRDRGVNAADRADVWSAVRHWAQLSVLIAASRAKQALLPPRRRAASRGWAKGVADSHNSRSTNGTGGS